MNEKVDRGIDRQEGGVSCMGSSKYIRDGLY